MIKIAVAASMLIDTLGSANNCILVYLVRPTPSDFTHHLTVSVQFTITHWGGFILFATRLIV